MPGFDLMRECERLLGVRASPNIMVAATVAQEPPSGSEEQATDIRAVVRQGTLGRRAKTDARACVRNQFDRNFNAIIALVIVGRLKQIGERPRELFAECF